MSIAGAIKRSTRIQIVGGRKKRKVHAQLPTPLEVMMSKKYQEWEARRRKIEQEIELLTQEADRAHDQLMERWAVGDPAFELNDYNLELLGKLKQAKKSLKTNLRAKPHKLP